MATYDPPQPTWKRVVAGTLDFLLAFFGLGLLLGRVAGGPQGSAAIPHAATHGFSFHLTGWTAILFLALLVAYFVVLGRTGGTVFQRLFGMTRAVA